MSVVAVICTIAIIAAVRVCWDLRNHILFWVTVAALTFFYAFLIFLIPWTDASLIPRADASWLDHKYFEIIHLFFCLSVSAVNCGCIRLVAKVMGLRGHNT
jgi:hypothetical protein